MSQQPSTYAVNPKTCIRCAACATVAPAHFMATAGPAKASRPPGTDAERRACEAALALCPTQAISAGVEAPTPEVLAEEPAMGPELTSGELFPQVADVAERVRWKFSDLPWASFEPQKATPNLRAVVREMAYSEQTTFSATQRFMDAFGSDTDFSQWVSVWFYEETRHPMVLLKWLALAGETPGQDFVTKGRESTPFMKSLTGTLVTNVISEVVGADAYRFMHHGAPEPLIAAISLKLCADEARHAASFFTYARRCIAASENPDRERLDALKVLHFWFNISQNVSHPVNEAMTRLQALLPGIGAPPFVPPRDRVARVVGWLTGLPIDKPADVPVQLLEHTRRMHAAGA